MNIKMTRVEAGPQTHPAVLHGVGSAQTEDQAKLPFEKILRELQLLGRRNPQGDPKQLELFDSNGRLRKQPQSAVKEEGHADSVRHPIHAEALESPEMEAALHEAALLVARLTPEEVKELPEEIQAVVEKILEHPTGHGRSAFLQEEVRKAPAPGLRPGAQDKQLAEPLRRPPLPGAEAKVPPGFGQERTVDQRILKNTELHAAIRNAEEAARPRRIDLPIPPQTAAVSRIQVSGKPGVDPQKEAAGIQRAGNPDERKPDLPPFQQRAANPSPPRDADDSGKTKFPAGRHNPTQARPSSTQAQKELEPIRPFDNTQTRLTENEPGAPKYETLADHPSRTGMRGREVPVVPGPGVTRDRPAAPEIVTPERRRRQHEPGKFQAKVHGVRVVVNPKEEPAPVNSAETPFLKTETSPDEEKPVPRAATAFIAHPERPGDRKPRRFGSRVRSWLHTLRIGRAGGFTDELFRRTERSTPQQEPHSEALRDELRQRIVDSLTPERQNRPEIATERFPNPATKDSSRGGVESRPGSEKFTLPHLEQETPIRPHSEKVGSLYRLTPSQIPLRLGEIISEQWELHQQQARARFLVDGGRLGAMEIKIQQEESHQHVTVLVETEHARFDLQRLLPQIQENLNQKGFQLSEMNVEVRDDAQQERTEERTANGNGDLREEDPETVAGVANTPGQEENARSYGYNTMEVLA